MRIVQRLLFAAFAMLILCADGCDDQQQQLKVAQDQQSRAKVSIAKQNEYIQKLRNDVTAAKEKVAAAENDVKVAESVVILCWDEQVVDLGNSKVCQAEAGGYFTPEGQNNNQVLGPYTPPDNGGRDQNFYCASTKVAIPQARFQTMSNHFESSCEQVWAERERQRKIAEDKALTDKAAADAEWHRLHDAPAKPAQGAPATTN